MWSFRPKTGFAPGTDDKQYSTTPLIKGTVHVRHLDFSSGERFFKIGF